MAERLSRLIPDGVSRRRPGGLMDSLLFNGRGLAWAVGLAAAAGGLTEAAAQVGWIARADEFPWFALLFSQAAAVTGLLWDRSDHVGYVRAYARHISEFAYHAAGNEYGDDRPHWYVPNPARRVLFFGLPLATYPFVFLLTTGGIALFIAGKEGEFQWASHPAFALAMILGSCSCVVTLLLARFTAKRRLVANPSAPKSSPAAPAPPARTSADVSQALFNMVDDEDRES